MRTASVWLVHSTSAVLATAVLVRRLDIMRYLSITLLCAAIFGLSCATLENLAGDSRPPSSDCQAHYVECLGTPLERQRGSVYGESICLTCKNSCVAGGSWPYWVEFVDGKKSCRWWDL